MELIIRRAEGRFQQPGTALPELPVQRQPVQVRAADHQPRSIMACNRRRCGSGQALLSLQGIGHAQQILIGEGPAKHCHAPWQAVVHERAGHGDGGVVEQVHEVGVVAEVRIAQYRFGLEFRQRHRAADGGRDDTIEAFQRCVAQGLERLQPVLGAEGLHAVDGGCLGQDSANHRQHGLGVLCHQLPGHAVALGHPRAFIEQACGLQKRRQVQFHRFAAQGLETIDGIAEQQRAFRASKELQVLCTWYAEPERPWCAERRAVIPQRVAAAVFVPRVEACGERQQLTGLPRGGSERSDAIEGTTGRYHAGRRDQALAGFHADQVVQRRWHAPGAGGVGPQGKARDPERHRQRRTGAGAARWILRQHAVGAHAIG
ncbi:hypothetical protein D3C73_766110 [compost metagenome]